MSFVQAANYSMSSGSAILFLQPIICCRYQDLFLTRVGFFHAYIYLSSDPDRVTLSASLVSYILS
jgi:hypothetical protein